MARFRRHIPPRFEYDDLHGASVFLPVGAVSARGEVGCLVVFYCIVASACLWVGLGAAPLLQMISGFFLVVFAFGTIEQVRRLRAAPQPKGEHDVTWMEIRIRNGTVMVDGAMCSGLRVSHDALLLNPNSRDASTIALPFELEPDELAEFRRLLRTTRHREAPPPKALESLARRASSQRRNPE